jgi:hydrogenase-4 component B
MSQIGFILTGTAVTVLMGAVGEKEAVMTALAGTVQHMVNHSLLKLTLFMCAGVVVMNLHSLTLDEIRGWGRNKTPLKIAFALGGLGISGVPLFNGYISKTLLHEGIVEAIHVMSEAHEFGLSTINAVIAGNISNILKIGEWIFLFSGGLTFAYMLKLFICIFVEMNRDEDVQERYESSTKCMNPVSTAAILGSSLFMVILGMPPVTKREIAFALGENEILEFAAFTPENLKGSAISLVIGALVYLTVVRHLLYREGAYVNRWPEKLDLEEGLYRPALTRWIPRVLLTIASVFGEDKILTPVCTFSFNLLQKIAYCFSVSTDYLILEMRRTALREKRVRRAGVGQVSHLRMLREGTAEAVNPILRNFTFALLMTCLGILMILGVLLIAIVHITP